MKPKHKFIDVGLHPLAISQARSHAKIARLAYKQLESAEDVAGCLSYLVNASFAIELYFKSLMIAGRNGQVAQSHDLTVLYDEFPEFLRRRMNTAFNNARPSKYVPIQVLGLIQSESPPDSPNESALGATYEDFQSAIHSLSNSFVRARYFFDEIGREDYSCFDVPVEPIEAVFSALDDTYNRFLAGEFEGAEYAAP